MSRKKNPVPVPDHLIHIDVYDMDVAIFFTPEGADYYLSEVYGEKDPPYVQEFEDGCTGAMAIRHHPESGGMLHIFIFPSVPQPGRIAHECSHMVDFISDTIDMPMNLHTTEPRGYLMGYLYEEVMAACMKWKKEHPEWPNSD
jgi:hypothetical protein